MIDKDTCHRCKSYVSLSGYCDNPDCVYSFNKSREADRRYGQKHTPPFLPRNHEEQREIERLRFEAKKLAYEASQPSPEAQKKFDFIVSIILGAFFGYLSVITLDGLIETFFSGGDTGVFYPILGAILVYFTLACLKAALDACDEL